MWDLNSNFEKPKRDKSILFCIIHNKCRIKDTHKAFWQKDTPFKIYYNLNNLLLNNWFLKLIYTLYISLQILCLSFTNVLKIANFNLIEIRQFFCWVFALFLKKKTLSEKIKQNDILTKIQLYPFQNSHLTPKSCSILFIYKNVQKAVISNASPRPPFDYLYFIILSYIYKVTLFITKDLYKYYFMIYFIIYWHHSSLNCNILYSHGFCPQLILWFTKTCKAKEHNSAKYLNNK